MSLPPGERPFANVKHNNNMLVPWYLMASYGYYHRDESLLKDTTFDDLCLSLDVFWDLIGHHHKHIIDREALSAGTCLLPLAAFPRRVIAASCLLLNIPEL